MLGLLDNFFSFISVERVKENPPSYPYPHPHPHPYPYAHSYPYPDPHPYHNPHPHPYPHSYPCPDPCPDPCPYPQSYPYPYPHPYPHPYPWSYLYPRFSNVEFLTDRSKKSRIPCPNFDECRSPGSNQIPFNVKVFCIFPNQALYLDQSRIPLTFSRILHRILVKCRFPNIPFQTLFSKNQV